LQCISADEVFTLLKSSTFIAHDLTCPYGQALGSDFKIDEHYLTLKHWHALNKAMEFRCFIKGKKLVGVS
jgi:hypothetical protein